MILLLNYNNLCGWDRERSPKFFFQCKNADVLEHFIKPSSLAIKCNNRRIICFGITHLHQSSPLTSRRSYDAHSSSTRAIFRAIGKGHPAIIKSDTVTTWNRPRAHHPEKSSNNDKRQSSNLLPSSSAQRYVNRGGDVTWYLGGPSSIIGCLSTCVEVSRHSRQLPSVSSVKNSTSWRWLPFPVLWPWSPVPRSGGTRGTYLDANFSFKPESSLAVAAVTESGFGQQTANLRFEKFQTMSTQTMRVALARPWCTDQRGLIKWKLNLSHLDWERSWVATAKKKKLTFDRIRSEVDRPGFEPRSGQTFFSSNFFTVQPFFQSVGVN